MTMTKDYILEQLHRLYRSDPWLNELLRAGTITMDQLAEKILIVYNSNWFDTMSEEYVDRYEKKLGITKNPSKTLTERRGIIEAKWKSSSKITLEMLQALMDSMGPGCTVEFDGGVINVTGDGFVPSESRMNALEEIKPAHLGIQRIGQLHLASYHALTAGMFVEVYGSDAIRGESQHYSALSSGEMVEIYGTTAGG